MTLISIITPAYNAETFISETIESVLTQDHDNWEFLIIDNNSTDQTIERISTFTDPRIKLLSEKRKGVGFARNVGLSNMKGDYFCFLDADDIMPKNALSARLEEFENNTKIAFVDGVVEYVDVESQPIGKKYTPDFKGYPYDQLLRLNSKCLFGNTWMIKRNVKEKYHFDTEMTHAEDLFFYLTISKDKQYSYTNETILLYRQRNDSAMRDLKGLESGYILLLKKIKSKLGQKGWIIIRLKLKIIKIMILSHLFDGRDALSAIKVPFKIMGA